MYYIATTEDDDKTAAQIIQFIRRYTEENELQAEVFRFADAESFLADPRRFDAVFMDIELPGLDGISAAKKLREKDQNVVLVFVTNMSQLAIRGYEVSALDFIVKPLLYADLAFKLDRVFRKLTGNGPGMIDVYTGGGIKRISSDALKYVEVLNHRCVYHLDGETVEFYSSLAAAEELLQPFGFLKCNRCYLINPKYITEVKDYTVAIGDETLQISRNQKKKFMRELNAYIAQGGCR